MLSLPKIGFSHFRQVQNCFKYFFGSDTSPFAFNIQVYTLAGVINVDFTTEFYQGLLLPLVAMSFLSSTFYIGRDTFCVSKYVLVQRQPAHQLCYQWSYGVRFSVLAGLACMSVSILGMVTLASRVISGYATCVETWITECLCGCTTSDMASTIKDTLLIYSK